jgi:hypothetical protein
MTEVDGAHLDSLGSVGHALPLVGPAADAVGILDDSSMNLERTKGMAIVPDGKVIARGLDEDEGGDKVGEDHGLASLLFHAASASRPVNLLGPSARHSRHSVHTGKSLRAAGLMSVDPQNGHGRNWNPGSSGWRS